MKREILLPLEAQSKISPIVDMTENKNLDFERAAEIRDELISARKKR